MLCDDCGANLICPYCTAASQPRTIQPPSTSLRRFFAVVLEMYSFLMLQAILPNRPFLWFDLQILSVARSWHLLGLLSALGWGDLYAAVSSLSSGLLVVPYLWLSLTLFHGWTLAGRVVRVQRRRLDGSLFGPLQRLRYAFVAMAVFVFYWSAELSGHFVVGTLLALLLFKNFGAARQSLFARASQSRWRVFTVRTPGEYWPTPYVERFFDAVVFPLMVRYEARFGRREQRYDQ